MVPRVESNDFGNESLECTDKFWYLGYMIGARSEAEATPIARVRSRWKKF